MSANLALQLDFPDQIELHSKIAVIEKQAASRLDKGENNQEITRKNSGLERIFGKTGKNTPILSPKHLLHTLPPDYPLYCAIDHLLKFLDELNNCLQTEQQNVAVLEWQIKQLLPGLSELEKKQQEIKQAQNKALLKFRFDKQLEQLSQQIAEIYRTLVRLVNQKKSSAAQIDNIKHDISAYQLRTAEVIEQYMDEVDLIPAEQMDPFLAIPAISALHDRALQSAEIIF